MTVIQDLVLTLSHNALCDQQKKLKLLIPVLSHIIILVKRDKVVENITACVILKVIIFLSI